MNKKRMMIILGLLISIILIIFSSFYYKTKKYGNNISRSTDNILEHILNISSYEAELEVTVKSNKTENKYKIKQLYSKPNIMKQIVKEPSNLENLIITYDGKNMKLENTKMSLSKVYEDYSYISTNTLWLSSFIDNYNKESIIKETEDEILIENQIIYNDYHTKQILSISKQSTLPTKLEIYDNNKNTKIYIKYNEIKLNKTKQNEILAFKYEKVNL